MESPDAICENTAPDMAKKKPAKAHSFSKGNLGISNAIDFIGGGDRNRTDE